MADIYSPTGNLEDPWIFLRGAFWQGSRGLVHVCVWEVVHSDLGGASSARAGRLRAGVVCVPRVVGETLLRIQTCFDFLWSATKPRYNPANSLMNSSSVRHPWEKFWKYAKSGTPFAGTASRAV